MKKCLFCAEEIQDAALKCKHCGEWIKTINVACGQRKIGEMLRIIRLQRNLTLGELSELSGVQSATLSRMETNKTLGILKNYILIAKALGCNLSELFATMNKYN